MKITLMIVIVTLMMVTTVNALNCLQESTNQSNQAGNDGSCNQNYSGNYSQGGYLYLGFIWVNELNATYVKPSGVTGAVSQYKIGNYNIKNATIPQSCWDYNPNYLMINLKSYAGSYTGSFIYCRNGSSSYAQLDNDYQGPVFSGGGPRVSNWTAIDGNYSSGARSNDGEISWTNDTTSGILSPHGFIYEEAMIWTYDYIINNYTFNNYTFETSNETFSINIDYDATNFPIASVYLNYNNTLYATTQSGSTGNYIFSKNLAIPLINQTQINNSLYWILSLTNSTGTFSYNTSFFNQSIFQVLLGNCGGSNSTRVLNITAYDQDTLAKIVGWNFKSTLDYYVSNSSSSRQVSFSDIGITEKNICANTNISFKISGQVEYSINSTYQTNNYYFNNFPVTNITTNVSLGFLPITSTTVFLVKLLDQYSLPVSGYYINIKRYYPGTNTYQTVQTLFTDSAGQSVAFIEVNNVYYQFEVMDPLGNIVLTTEKKLITPQTSPYTITINIGTIVQGTLTYNYNLTGLSYQLSFDKNSKLVTYAYADTNSSFTSAELRVFNVNGGSNTLVCDNNLTTANGVITCDLTNSTGNFNAQAYNYRNSVIYYIDNLIFEVSDEDYSGLGIFGGICILLVCAFAFSFNEVTGIVMINLGMIAVQILHLINFGWITITASVAISIIILIVLERG